MPELNLPFHHFLIRDDAPLLDHTGMKIMFPATREAVPKIIDPVELRGTGCSSFEVDECGALNEWLAVAPQAQAACSRVGALVNLNDFAARPKPRSNDKVKTISSSSGDETRPRWPCWPSHSIHWRRSIRGGNARFILFDSDPPDSPKANSLGLHRASFYNEQEGHLETFRPYPLPENGWTEEAARNLAQRLG